MLGRRSGVKTGERRVWALCNMQRWRGNEGRIFNDGGGWEGAASGVFELSEQALAMRGAALCTSAFWKDFGWLASSWLQRVLPLPPTFLRHGVLPRFLA